MRPLLCLVELVEDNDIKLFHRPGRDLMADELTRGGSRTKLLKMLARVP